MRQIAVFALIGITACPAARTTPHARTTEASSAARDTAAIRAAAATHYSRSDSAVSRSVTIRSDTAWATVRHGRFLLTIVQLERRNGHWRFVREVVDGIP